MDDLEFRRRLLSDPTDDSQDILSELNQSPQRKKYAEGLLDLEHKLENAFKVDVPDDLADKIIFQSTSPKRTVNVSRRVLALAASVIFTFGLFIGQVNWGALLVTPAHASLETMAMNHVKEEEAFTAYINEANSSQEIQAKLQVYSYQLVSDFPYHIYYLNHCGFSPKHHALHMVFQGKNGRVTAFVSNIEARTQSQFEDSGMSGEITPLKQGSLVLVGEKGEDLTALSQQIAPLLTFKG
ncbi:DUF3379 family protein [Vibrio gangliei]|uniref:DUF3379 family protein n=1 Tax=Vibrio gangliei TaxID=2077090 RepID=UPI000D013430|nr:DUF3379 family protein [Vibrio gangliei]